MNPPLASIFVLKIAELCNLNCSYCYMYHKGDTSFRSRPKFMSKDVAAAMLVRIASYAQRHSLAQVTLALHGGEPFLAGKEWILWFLQEARRVERAYNISFQLAAQTNGTLLDMEWLKLLAGYEVALGVSCDGPKEWHDLARPDFSGHGSYEAVKNAIALLANHYTASWGVLTVANPAADSAAVLQHFVDLGVHSIDFLWPEYHHDDPPPFPPGAMGKYFVELFDFWYGLSSPPQIRWFEDAMRLLLGGSSSSDCLGPHPIADIMVESDGAWEPLDTLRICGNGMTRTGLDVLHHDVEEIWKVPLYQIGLRNQELLSDKCLQCAMRAVCGGGFLPHRFRKENGFANPSVYCEELLTVLTHIRAQLLGDLRPVLTASACS